MSIVRPLALPRATNSQDRLLRVWATGVGGALLATGATGFLSPIEGILQGAFAGIALGVAVIGFIVAFVASDRMDSIERDSEVSS